MCVWSLYRDVFSEKSFLFIYPSIFNWKLLSSQWDYHVYSQFQWIFSERIFGRSNEFDKTCWRDERNEYNHFPVFYFFFFMFDALIYRR